MKKENNILIYLKKLSKRWWILLALVPSFLDVFNFYLKLPKIILSWQISLILFSLLFFVANYFVWKEEQEEKIKLQEELRKIEDKKPKLKISFEKDKTTFLLKNKIFERTLNESFQGIRPINPNVLQRLIGSLNNPIIDEIHEAFIPLKFELYNEGDFKATDVSVDIYFPKDLILIEELPKQNNFIHIGSLHKKNYGRFFQKKNHLRLWCDKSQHPYYLSFEEIYIFSKKKGKFKVKYEIHSDELNFKGIEGELIINAKPIHEIKEYSIKSELDKDVYKYNEIVESKLKEIENEN